MTVLRRMPPAVLAVLVFAAQVAVLAPVAIFRDLDADEGFYVIAGTQVVHGHVPYQDFFFTQMPALPYAYGAWTAVLGDTWNVARALSVVITAALGVLVLRHVTLRLKSPGLGVVAALLYLSSTYVLWFMPIVKTYALAGLLLFAAMVVVDRADPGARGRWLAAGVLLGLAIDVRLLFAATVPVFFAAAWLAAGPGRRERRAPALAMLGGIAAGVLPSVVLFLLEPSRFVFNNFTFHSVRGSAGPLGNWGQRLDVVVEFVTQAQDALLMLAAVGALAAVWMVRRTVPLSLAIAGTLMAVSLVPDPTVDQYFVSAIPFLVVGAMELVPLLPGLSDRLGAPWLARRGLPLLALGAAIYVAVPLIELPRELRHGYFAGGDPAAETVRLDSVRDVTRAIDAASAPGEHVLAFWPGYLFGSHARVVPGFENDFSMEGVVNAKLSEADARRYRLVSPRHMTDFIAGRRSRLIVLGPLGYWTQRRDWLTLVLRSGYRPIAGIGLTRVYERGDPAPVNRRIACLRSAGLAPRLSAIPPIGAGAIEVALPHARTGFLYVYTSPARARAAAPAIARLLEAGGGGARPVGDVVVGFVAAPTRDEARRMRRCAA